MSTSLNNNMYRVGDYVYFEVHAGQPYQIRRIEELSRTLSGKQVEVKVLCFFRRRDIPSSLLHLADRHYNICDDDDSDMDVDDKSGSPESPLSEEARHRLRHRELFLSRQLETVPAQYIRGKCTVHLLSEVESMSKSYLNRDDLFFYTLVYDPVAKTLLADRGEIRVGTRFQAEIPPMLSGSPQSDINETLVWKNDQLDDVQVERLMIIARSVGTYARALDASSSVREQSLQMSAAAASRDITTSYALKAIHEANYDPMLAAAALVPDSGPLLCRDQMEAWSASEANLFEEALDKYGKDFNDVRRVFLPWKPLSAIIEYYYMWKTTDRYMRQKRIKAADNENKLKQVYIPNNGNYNNPNKVQSTGNSTAPAKVCEGCSTTQSPGGWYMWGPNNLCRLCDPCWLYWKKLGGLKKPTSYEGGISPTSTREQKYECKVCRKVFNRQERLVNHMSAHSEFKCKDCSKEFKIRSHLQKHLAAVHGLVLTSKDTYAQTVRTRQPFLMQPTKFSYYCRLLVKDLIVVQKLARRPLTGTPDGLEAAVLKAVNDRGEDTPLPKLKTRNWISLTDLIPKLEELARANLKRSNAPAISDIPYKRRATGQLMPSRNFVASGRHVNWLETKENVMFVANEKTRQLRAKINSDECRRAGRKPTRLLEPKDSQTGDAIIID